MNLYMVLCTYRGSSLGKPKLEYECVYVTAPGPSSAEGAALELMRHLKYKYTDYVASIQLLASTNTHNACKLLVCV